MRKTWFTLLIVSILMLTGCGAAIKQPERGTILTPTPTPTPDPIEETEDTIKVPDEEADTEEVQYEEPAEAGVVEDGRTPIITKENGYQDLEAQEELQKLYELIESSEQWQEYEQYNYGIFATSLENYNVRRNGNGYILDYSDKFEDNPLYRDFTVEITVDGNDIGIYITDENRAEIMSFVG